MNEDKIQKPSKEVYVILSNLEHKVIGVFDNKTNAERCIAIYSKDLVTVQKMQINNMPGTVGYVSNWYYYDSDEMVIRVLEKAPSAQELGDKEYIIEDNIGTSTDSFGKTHKYLMSCTIIVYASSADEALSKSKSILEQHIFNF